MLRSPQFLQLSRLLFLVFGAASLSNVSLAAGGHCERHAGHTGQTRAHAAGTDHHLPGAWQPPAHGDCPHCPASDCAHLTPCATTTNVAVATETRALARSPIQS